MNAYIKNLLEHLESQLANLSLSSENIISGAVQTHTILSSVLGDLKSHIKEHGFPSEDARIHFFKNVKPRFLQYNVFYAELLHLETRRPVGSSDALKVYLVSWVSHISLYFERNRFLYNYWKSGSVYLDTQLFLDDPITLELPFLPDKYAVDMDMDFSNTYSYKLGKFRGYQMLLDYISDQQQEMDKTESVLSVTENKNYPMGWTDSKTDLIELAYAFYAHKSINRGKVHIKQIIQALEALFHVDLGNFYRVAQGQRIRKHRTAYLEELKSSLEKWMDETDLG